ncbi:MAG TPA: alpha/beta fold hydrolase [Steroidobacteraceae bacterium]|nr:alpha/beta fold hydrolase [Steroidobacteraceae bacterium]
MSAAASALDHVTPYDRFAWSDAQIAQSLASGVQRRELSAYFGASEYRALAALAQRARRVRVAEHGLRVLVVPGIMGSQLGLLRAAPLPNNIIWLDPIDIQHGRLAALRLPAAAPVVPLGVVLFSYLRLQLYLRARGFAAEFHDYDWRLPVVESGRALAQRLRAAKPARIAIVAHSMGGLVSRAALALADTAHVERLVLLGTPNSGSFAAVQALRGTYAVVRKVASLAGTGMAETLAAETFNTFPSLYDLLPRGACAGGTDLFEPRNWPAAGPQPQAALLQAARGAHERLAPADERFAVIAGVGEETVTAVARRGDDFLYTLTRHGDGTVPLVSAELAGARSFCARVAHSDLTRDPRVAAAVVELLERGATSRLPAKWVSRSRARAQVSDRRLRRGHAQQVDWGALNAEERRVFLQNLNEPPRFTLRTPGRSPRAGPHPAADRGRRRGYR